MPSLYARGSAGIGQASAEPRPVKVQIPGVWLGGALVGGGLVLAALMRSHSSQRRTTVDLVQWLPPGPAQSRKARKIGYRP